MKFIMCSIRDLATEVYARPFYVAAAAQAVRSFSDEVNRSDVQNDLFNHPDDFELFELGEFVDDSASFVIYPEPVRIARAKDLKKS